MRAIEARRTRQLLKHRIDELTERERDVMRCVVEGLPNKLIAEQLSISVRTVEVHRARVFEKMNVKSAVELAMERLEKKTPSVALTQEQKAQIADIDSTFKARIAERELFLKAEIAKASEAGNREETESLQKQLAIDIRRLQEDAEAKKEKLRASFSQ